MKNLVIATSISLFCSGALTCSGHAEQSEVDSSFFGGGGYFHPYISTTGMYDDNVYKSEDDTQSDTAIIVSPGIWVAFPTTRKQVMKVETTNLTPGGLRMQQDRGQRFRRMQGYLHYGGSFTRFNEATDTDSDDHRVEGYFAFNTKGGLTLEIMDFYLDGHNDWGEGISDGFDTFTSNLVGGRATYDIGARFRVRASYSVYTVGYDQDYNATRDRQDNKLSTRLYYKLSPKKSALVGYDFLDVDYDQWESLNSKQHYMFGGFRWRASEKTMGEVKAGYQTKDYADSGYNSDGDFFLSAWMDYELTGKTALRLLADRIYEEPGSYTVESKLSTRGKLVLSHQLTSKFETRLSGEYIATSYNGEYVYNDVTYEREDDEYSMEALIEYNIQDWLSTQLKYKYYRRDTNVDGLSYDDNRFLLGVTCSL
ncbi:outer membrane beta-barrel protein [Desulfogranum japonicum]|uniref:outer membrane beta-barrel protein n=1 Tax=Desulfogranum japonicum TaxID=231447 RepID=UPI00048EC1E4|nr:outer membrane beta-barrel protein [Desulfogranum japonicum]